MDSGENGFMVRAIEAAQNCESEEGKISPRVGAVVVDAVGAVLAVCHRGMFNPGDHAEYCALHKSLEHVDLSSCTVYTTLEPCTSRGERKTPCADRLIARKVFRVVIGMLDPDVRIYGKGYARLINAGVKVDMFPYDLRERVEALNLEFTANRRNLKLESDEAVSSLFRLLKEGYIPEYLHGIVGHVSRLLLSATLLMKANQIAFEKTVKEKAEFAARTTELNLRLVSGLRSIAGESSPSSEDSEFGEALTGVREGRDRILSAIERQNSITEKQLSGSAMLTLLDLIEQIRRSADPDGQSCDALRDQIVENFQISQEPDDRDA